MQHATQPYLVIITGFPGTGKTHLGTAVADHLQALFLSKDALKERVFDTLGVADQAWSRQVSGTAHRIMDDITAQELSLGHGVVLESNFKPEVDSVRFTKLAQSYDAAVVQLLCWADGAVLFERFMKRQHSAARHAGHVLDISEDQIRADLAPGKCEPLALDAPLLYLDTTDLTALHYDALLQQIATILNR